MESLLRTPTSHKNEAEAPPGETEARPFPRARWRPLQLLLRLRAFDALHHHDYRLLWYGQIFASMGTWMDQVTRGWLIYELTGSALQLGLVRGIQAIPFLLLSPIAGSAADRYSRKTQVVVSQLVNGLLYAVTAALIIIHAIEPWHVYVTAFLMACVQVFLQPSRAVMISDIVPPEHLTNAIGLNAVVFNMARSTGPALSGLLISLFGTGISYALQAAFLFLATVWTVRISDTLRTPRAHRSAPAHEESFGQSIIEGWKFSWRNETVRIGLMVVVFASLFMIPFSTLLPVFAKDLLGVGARGQGLLLTSMGIGALCSSFLIASVGDRMPRGILMIAGVGIYGVLVVIFSASSWFPLSMALMAVIGLCHVASHALVQTILQTYSPQEFRGRTMAIFHMTHVVLLLGGTLIGALSSLVGAPWATASMSIVGTLFMIGIYVRLPAARSIR